MIDFAEYANFQEKQLEAWNALLDPKVKYLLYGGAACFTPDTLVLTENGHVAISKVKIGTKVFSLKKGKLELSRVTNTFSYGGNKRQEMIKFVVNGESIICTPQHKFYIDGDWVSASILYKRILAICGGDKQQLLDLKSRSFTNKELEEYWQGFDNETSLRWQNVSTDNDRPKWQGENGKNPSTSSSGVDSKSRKQTAGESQELPHRRQSSGKFGMGYWIRKLHTLSKGWKNEPLEKVYLREPEIPTKGGEKRTINSHKKAGSGNSPEIYTEKSNEGNIGKGVWSGSIYYKRYCSKEKLEACELDIREIDSVEYTHTDGKVYDLEVENVNYIVSRENIIVHNSGGKSYFLRWAAFGLGLYYFSKYGVRDFVIGMFCEDYPTLKDRQIIRMKTEFPRELGEIRDRQDEGYAFKAGDEYGGFFISLRNLDDPSKYQSSEFAAIFVDEITRNPPDTFDDLRFRLRWAGIPDVKLVGATNPGGVGHAKIKGLWITPDPKHPDPEQEMFLYIPSTVYDNKYIDKGYIKQLKALPDHKRKAFLEGSWDIFAGQVFNEWNVHSHVIDPFRLDPRWRRYMSLDWGVNAQTAVGWYAIDEERRIYLYRELYMNGDKFKETYGMDLTPSNLAIVLNDINNENDEVVEYVATDPACWNRPEGGESIAETMIRYGLPLIKGDNNRANGLARFREMLQPAPDGKPWFQVFRTCYDFIRTIPSLPYDKHRIDDVDTKTEDHFYDSTRLFFMSRPSPTSPVKEDEPIMRRVYKQALKRYNQTDNYYDEGLQ